MGRFCEYANASVAVLDCVFCCSHTGCVDSCSSSHFQLKVYANAHRPKFSSFCIRNAHDHASLVKFLNLVAGLLTNWAFIDRVLEVQLIELDRGNAAL